jgi:REP element-mobilizing transposase RayT
MPMNGDPIAFFITWTTYGTWLPGDERGWVQKGNPNIQQPNFSIQQAARAKMTGEPVALSPAMRSVVDQVIVDHVRIRGWLLHARNVRSNHIHVVVSANCDPEKVREQLKAWGSRRLSEFAGFVGRGKNGQKRWWTEGGDIEWIMTRSTCSMPSDMC